MLLLVALSLAAADPPALPEGPALTEAIRARDSELFALMFEGCDPARLATMITPDVEMYHDRDGVVARSAEAFVADYRRWCTQRREPNAWRSRRALWRTGPSSQATPSHSRSRSSSSSPPGTLRAGSVSSFRSWPRSHR